MMASTTSEKSDCDVAQTTIYLYPHRDHHKLDTANHT